MTMLILSFTNVWGQGVSTWDGTISTSLTQQEGVYLIQSAADLAFLAQEVNKGTTGYASASYKLTTDIDLNNKEWTSIGNNNTPTAYTFTGTFDGNNHIVSNFVITTDRWNGNGLFGKVQNGKIKNIGIQNASVKNKKQNIGILIGETQGPNTSIQNCFVTNSSLELAGGNGQYGCIVGRTYNAGNIENCYVHNTTLKISGTATEAGLLIGAANKTLNVKNCYTSKCTINITSQADQSGTTGAFCGHVNYPSKTDTITFDNCYAQKIESISYVGNLSPQTIFKQGERLTINNLADLNGKLYLEETPFTNGEVSWLLNTTNGTTTNSAIWSHNGTYPVFADNNNYPTYKMEGATIYKGGDQSTVNYTLSQNNDITSIVFDATKATDIPQDSLINLGSANCLKYVGNLNYSGNNIIKDGTTPTITLTDGKPFYCPIAISNATVSYTRNFAEGWNTMCLPFAYTIANENEDKIEKLTAGTTETVSFEYVTDATEANTPYLINIKTGGEKTFTASGASIPVSSAMNDVTADGYTFTGIFTPSTVTSGYGLVLDETTQTVMFKKIPADGKEITSFRAYLGTASPASAPLRIIHGDGDGGATDVEKTFAADTFQVYGGNNCIDIVCGKAQTVNVFGIDGRLVKTAELNEGLNSIPGVTKGIYVVNNQKVLVK